MVSLSPLVEPGDELSVGESARAARQLLLPGFGSLAQRRLAAARVLVIGAGGLGSPVLQYLAGAGIGRIGIVDFDTVDLSNLHRQVIHRTADVGEPKVSSAARAIAELAPQVIVDRHPVKLDSSNALELFAGYDLVVDGSDNFATRYLANDAAALLGMPYIWGSVLRFDGQVTVFWEGAPDGRSLDYRDLHPTPPAPGDVLSCDEAGVLGTVCGIIGSMMANETVKVITGTGDPLLGRVASFDALAGHWREFSVRRSPSRVPVAGLIDYDLFCGIGATDDALLVATISPAELAGRLGLSKGLSRGGVTLIDVREPFEHEAENIAGDILIPLGGLLADPAIVPTGVPDANEIVVYCLSGARSARAVEALREHGVSAVSLAGGIRAWREHVEDAMSVG